MRQPSDTRSPTAMDGGIEGLKKFSDPASGVGEGSPAGEDDAGRGVAGGKRRPLSAFEGVIPGPQIHDSWALPQWGRVRFNTANRGGSSCRLRYHYARILMRRSCGVWPGEAKMALKPDGFWRLLRSMTVRRAPRRPRS